MRLGVLAFLLAALFTPSVGWSSEHCVVYGKVYRAGGAINLELNSTCGPM